MSPEQFRKVRALFDEALQVAPDERQAWCEEACAGDASALAELQRLLARDANLQRTPTVPAAELVATALDASDRKRLSGMQVGRYTLVSELGQGGMGRVFLALREDAGVRQEVAVKLLRREMIDTALLERFHAERRILAGLSHPAIARLLDFGETADGIPYVAMELVRGMPITQYCAERQLGLPQRLKLFRQVLAAVAHAHRNLIVHRDIKPANVLVDDEGQVKLLDFGIAKPLQAGNAATQTGQRYLTPGYAAPEQFLGGDISVMSDVYGLGALLYELLAGRPPIALDVGTAAELERRVLHVPPEALERAAASDASTREALGCADSKAWRRSLRGDLDAIVQKALRKEAAGRYLSVEAFDADLERYLERRPVLASGHSQWYRIGKFIQRNRSLVAVVMVALIGIGAALAMALRQAHLAAAERDSARAAMAVLSDSFRAADPLREAKGNVTAAQILKVAAEKTADLRLTQPRVHAALTVEIGEAELALGSELLTRDDVELALDWQRRDGSSEPLLGRRLQLLHARQLVSSQDLDAAEREIDTLQREDPRNADILVARAHFLSMARRAAEAVETASAAEAILAADPGSPRHSDAVWQLSEAHYQNRDTRAAIAVLDDLVGIYAAQGTPGHSRALLTRLRRLRLHLSAGESGAELVDEARQLTELLGTQFEPHSSVMGLAQSSLAMALTGVGDREGAIAAHRSAVAAYMAIYGGLHGNTLRARFNLAEQLAETGSAEAESAFDALYADARLAGQADTPLGVYFRHKYARLLMAQAELAAARRVLLPKDFAPQLTAMAENNREALAEDLSTLFGPIDCATQHGTDQRAHAARIVCAVAVMRRPKSEL